MPACREPEAITLLAEMVGQRADESDLSGCPFKPETVGGAIDFRVQNLDQLSQPEDLLFNSGVWHMV